MRWRASLLLFLLAGCGGRAYNHTGLASWYGSELAGRPTASGEPFDPSAMTAAHRTLPLGTIADVTALGTRRHVRVTINDRGPRDHGRLIDLSRGAADALGTRRAGLAKVRVRAVGRRQLLPRGRPVPVRGPWLVEVARTPSLDAAEAIATGLGGAAERSGMGWRVILGPFAAVSDANAARDDLVQSGYRDARTLSAP